MTGCKKWVMAIYKDGNISKTLLLITILPNRDAFVVHVSSYGKLLIIRACKENTEEKSPQNTPNIFPWI